jgi:hypothetical protein
MLDVRNAIARVLDRYSLADIVEITLRKLRRDKIAPVFAARSFDLQGLVTHAVLLTTTDRGRRKIGAGKRRTYETK